MNTWQPIETAPKDGTHIWGWLYDTGIVLVRWMQAAEAAEIEGGNADDFEPGWINAGDLSDSYWKPKFWKPLEDIGVPNGVVLVHDSGEVKWRDENKAA